MAKSVDEGHSQAPPWCAKAISLLSSHTEPSPTRAPTHAMVTVDRQ
jgi:hypothetical protein